MIISKLITEKYIYINLHAEQVITANYLESSREGIFVTELNLTTLKNVVEDLSLLTNEDKRDILILDFNFLAFLQPNLKNIFIELKNAGYKIIFLNIEKKIIEENGFDIVTNTSNEYEGSMFKKFYFFEGNDPSTMSVELDIDSVFYKKFKEILIANKCNEQNIKHTSSFVYISSYIDIKKIITFQRNFILYAIYKLAIKISEEFLKNKETAPKLVCQSLNGSFIASILSTYLNLDIVIFDKIGPVNKLYSRLNKVIEEDCEYIVISDLVCLGTEVKIVRNLIQFLGGKYLGSIALIKVETLHKSHIDKIDTTTAVFSIRNSNNLELGYKIYTNLEETN
ncbi:MULTISPECIES: hypothetical protein [Weeksellaceae]|uniref:hypothetical protein n=1 Tax=Weeksellaceae TaxID=2762318 RepID=UPI001AE82E15|nr:hypothetical protein [Chryseobacterium jejuense]MBP2619097.1 hypothetical protein [Chryseobacterium jejuense]